MKKSLTMGGEIGAQNLKSQEPRAKSQEPRAKSQEPRAKSQEPRAKSQVSSRLAHPSWQDVQDSKSGKSFKSEAVQEPSPPPDRPRAQDPRANGILELKRQDRREPRAKFADLHALACFRASMTIRRTRCQAQTEIWSGTMTVGPIRRWRVWVQSLEKSRVTILWCTRSDTAVQPSAHYRPSK